MDQNMQEILYEEELKYQSRNTPGGGSSPGFPEDSPNGNPKLDSLIYYEQPDSPRQRKRIFSPQYKSLQHGKHMYRLQKDAGLVPANNPEVINQIITSTVAPGAQQFFSEVANQNTGRTSRQQQLGSVVRRSAQQQQPMTPLDPMATNNGNRLAAKLVVSMDPSAQSANRIENVFESARNGSGPLEAAAKDAAMRSRMSDAAMDLARTGKIMTAVSSDMYNTANPNLGEVLEADFNTHNLMGAAEADMNARAIGKAVGADLTNRALGQAVNSHMNARVIGNAVSSDLTNRAFGDAVNADMNARVIGNAVNADMNARAIGNVVGADLSNRAIGEAVNSHMNARTLGNAAVADMNARNMGNAMNADLNARVIGSAVNADMNARALGSAVQADLTNRVIGEAVNANMNARTLGNAVVGDMNTRNLMNTVTSDIQRQSLREDQIGGVQLKSIDAQNQFSETAVKYGGQPIQSGSQHRSREHRRHQGGPSAGSNQEIFRKIQQLQAQINNLTNQLQQTQIKDSIRQQRLQSILAAKQKEISKKKLQIRRNNERLVELKELKDAKATRIQNLKLELESLRRQNEFARRTEEMEQEEYWNQEFDNERMKASFTYTQPGREPYPVKHHHHHHHRSVGRDYEWASDRLVNAFKRRERPYFNEYSRSPSSEFDSRSRSRSRSRSPRERSYSPGGHHIRPAIQTFGRPPVTTTVETKTVKQAHAIPVVQAQHQRAMPIHLSSVRVPTYQQTVQPATYLYPNIAFTQQSPQIAQQIPIKTTPYPTGSYPSRTLQTKASDNKPQTADDRSLSFNQFVSFDQSQPSIYVRDYDKARA